MSQIMTDFFINPPREWYLVDILFYASPNKLSYKTGEVFDPTGLVVEAIYNNNLREKVSNYAYSPTGELTETDTKVTISYTDENITKTRDIAITVVPVLTKIEITTMPDKTSYIFGEQPDYTGMVVTATYSNGTTKIVTNYLAPTTALSTLGSIGLTITYIEDDKTFTDEVPITVAPKIIESIPTQSNTLTYNGSPLFPTWAGYNVEELGISGETSGTNAGSYNVSFTPKYGFCWADTSTTVKDTTWSISKAQIGSMPVQNGSLTYNGSAQVPTWANYNSTELTIGGESSATNAGTYTANFTPTDNYVWWDNTTESKETTWSIGKAPTTISISPTSLNITANNNPTTIILTSSRDRRTDLWYELSTSWTPEDAIEVGLVCDDDDVPTGEVEITGLNNANAELTFVFLENENYLASEAVTVSIEVKLETLYTVDLTASPEEGGTVSGSGTYPAGTHIIISATPNDNYKFVRWDGGGSSIETLPSFGIDINYDWKMTAIFKDKSALPDGYTKLEYITNPNFGYIKDVFPSTNNKQYKTLSFELIIDFIAATTSTSNGLIFGHEYTPTGKYTGLCLGYIPSSNYFRLWYGSRTNSSSAYYQSIVNPTGKVTIIIDMPNNNFQVNSTTTTISSSTGYSTARTTGRSFSLFSSCTYKTTTSVTYGNKPSNFKFYELKCAESGDTFCHFVPCINPNGYVGVYDIIKDAFYSSSDSSKPFVAGPEV